MSFSIGKCPLHVQKTRNSRKNLRIAADAIRAGDNTLLRAGKKAGMHEKKEHNMVSKQTRADRMRRVFVKSMVFSLAVAAMASLPLFSPASAAAAELAGKKTLIVYYSWSGNTRQVAQQIQQAIQADAVELKTVDPYPADYRQTTAQAKREQEAGYRPPLQSPISNLDAYDVIILGSPNWWGTVALPIFTFLETHDLTGKTIAMYVTHEGSRLGRSMDDLKRLCPGSTILDGLAIRGGSVSSAQGDVAKWLRTVGLLR